MPLYPNIVFAYGDVDLFRFNPFFRKTYLLGTLSNLELIPNHFARNIPQSLCNILPLCMFHHDLLYLAIINICAAML